MFSSGLLPIKGTAKKAYVMISNNYLCVIICLFYLYAPFFQIKELKVAQNVKRNKVKNIS